MRCQHLASLLPHSTIGHICENILRLDMYEKVVPLLSSELTLLALDNSTKVVLWSAIEPCVGIICACLPTLGPVFQRRTLQAIIDSVGSFFTIHSKQNSDSQYSLPTVNELVTRKQPSDSKARPYYPMDDEQSLVTSVQPLSENERRPEDFPLESIMVNSSMERNVEQRKL